MRRTTIKDVAALAGVSPATVSRTLDDRPEISAETKERVRAACAQLGYVPNAAAINEAVEIAKNFKTLYVMGCFGAPLTGSNVSRYCNNHSYNRAADRTAMIKAAGNQNPPVYGFDCVCLIKGILWGWSGNASKTYGGANYASNGCLLYTSPSPRDCS